jgi:hypothetical protein
MPTLNETQAKIMHFLIKFILRNKKVTLGQSQVLLLLSDLEEKMISQEYFDRPLCDIDCVY